MSQEKTIVKEIKSANKDQKTEATDIAKLKEIAEFMVSVKMLEIVDCKLERSQVATIKHNREKLTATHICFDAEINVERFGGDENTTCKIFVSRELYKNEA